MSILIVGFDTDLAEVKENLGDVPPSVYLESIPIGRPVYEPTSIQEVPTTVDAIVFVYSKLAHTSSQLPLYYGKIQGRFTSEQYYYYCLESFQKKDMLDENITGISLEKLQSLVST